MEILIVDAFRTAKLCLGMFASADLAGFLVAASLGALLGAAAWWGCSRFAKLWNLKYSLRGAHHALCALSASLVFAAVLLGGALRYTEEVADSILGLWAEELQSDGLWIDETFTKSYDAVKRSGKEDFAGYPDPRDGGDRIPLTQPGSQEILAAVHAESALANFKSNHPILAAVLSGDNKIPESVIAADVRSYFQANPGGTYPGKNAIFLAVNHAKLALGSQVPKVVFYSRLALAAVFLLCLFLTLAAVSVGAFSDIQVHRANA